MSFLQAALLGLLATVVFIVIVAALFGLIKLIISLLMTFPNFGGVVGGFLLVWFGLSLQLYLGMKND